MMPPANTRSLKKTECPTVVIRAGVIYKMTSRRAKNIIYAYYRYFMESILRATKTREKNTGQ